jgi:transposase
MTLRVRALSEEEGDRLARMTRSQKLGAGLVRRAQIIQHAVAGLSAPGVAAKMGLCGATVRFWLKRFNERGLPGLEEDCAQGVRRSTLPRSAARSLLRRCPDPPIWACRSHRGRWTAWWPTWARRASA